LDSKGKDALKRIDMFRNVFADPEALTIRITVLRRHRQPSRAASLPPNGISAGYPRYAGRKPGR
jgi:hypothetical protein